MATMTTTISHDGIHDDGVMRMSERRTRATKRRRDTLIGEAMSPGSIEESKIPMPRRGLGPTVFI